MLLPAPMKITPTLHEVLDELSPLQTSINIASVCVSVFGGASSSIISAYASRMFAFSSSSASISRAG